MERSFRLRGGEVQRPTKVGTAPQGWDEPFSFPAVCREEIGRLQGLLTSADMTDEELIQIVADAPEELQPTMWLMLTTGCHAIDCSKLLQAVVKKDELQVWHWTKSITKRKGRQTENYPLVCKPPASFIKSLILRER